MLLEQPLHLSADRGQRAVLDFHQHVIGHHIDAEPVQPHFLRSLVDRIELLQLPMERVFHGVLIAFPPLRRQIDASFWEKYQAVKAGDELGVARCYGETG